MHFMGRMSKGIEFERQEKMKWIWYNNRFLHHNSTGKFKEENTEILGKFYFFCTILFNESLHCDKKIKIPWTSKHHK